MNVFFCTESLWKLSYGTSGFAAIVSSLSMKYEVINGNFRVGIKIDRIWMIYLSKLFLLLRL